MKAKSLLIPFFVGLLLTSTLTSCRIGGSGNGEDQTKTNISFCTFQGTGGTDWIEAALKRFAEKQAEHSYEENKKGISYTVVEKGTIANGSKILEEGYDIYLDEALTKVYENAEGGFTLDLSSVVSSLGDKIDKDCLKRMKGPDGKYYALPNYEWFCGIPYDIDYLDSKDLYFAAPDEEEAEEATSSAKKYYKNNEESFKFVLDHKTCKKSTGPDGVYGTYDDGLPSSIQEFCIWCEQIKSVGGKPFLFSGAGSVYSFYITNAIWACLAGSEKMKNCFCNYTDADIEVVTGYSESEELFYEGSGIKKPITQVVHGLNDENGYYMYDMVERYYGLAFLELMIKEEWCSEKDLNSANQSPFIAQGKFINRTDDGQAYAMLVDGSYWYHEALENGHFDNLESERNLGFMPLPVQMDGKVDEKTAETANKQTLINVGSSYLYASSALEDNPGKKQAVLDFLEFLYSEDEANKFFESKVLTVPVNYSLDKTNIDQYSKNFLKLKENSDVIQPASDTKRYNKNTVFFAMYYNSSLINFTYKNKQYHDIGYRDYIRLYGMTADVIFECGRISPASWASMEH